MYLKCSLNCMVVMTVTHTVHQALGRWWVSSFTVRTGQSNDRSKKGVRKLDDLSCKDKIPSCPYRAKRRLVGIGDRICTLLYGGTLKCFVDDIGRAGHFSHPNRLGVTPAQIRGGLTVSHLRHSFTETPTDCRFSYHRRHFNTGLAPRGTICLRCITPTPRERTRRLRGSSLRDRPDS
jgi:hypothetical protein